jgi:hypothetical protein
LEKEKIDAIEEKKMKKLLKEGEETKRFYFIFQGSRFIRTYGF